MSATINTTANAWLPEDFGGLLSLEVQTKAVVAQVSEIFGTDKTTVNFPLWTQPVETAFYNELDEIAPSDGATDEVVITPAKVAGLHLASSELFDDADPDIASQIGRSLANQISHSLDAAMFANTTTKGYDGLLAKAYTAVDSESASLANLDKFVSARFAAEANGAQLTHWLMAPTVAEALSNLKQASGSNVPLLQFVQDGIEIAGLPVITSTHVDIDTICWGIDKSQQRFVVRKDAKVERFPSVTNDGQYVRGIMRAGWDTLNPSGLVRIHNVSA